MTRLRRSLLFVPGTRPERIAKAASSAADGVILDLEDAVAPAQKGQARDWVVAALKRVEFAHRERIVRINALSGPLSAADLAAVVPAAPDALLLPKVARVDELHAADREVGRLEAGAGRPGGRIRFHVLIETVAGLADVAALARAVPRTAALFYGAGDLAREACWQLVPSRIPELHAMSQLLLAARAAGLAAIDSPCFELEHAFQIEAHTRFGAELGFDGKAVIHPNQIESANRLFAPSMEAIQEAERVLAAYEAAEAEGAGALALDGQFVDAVHVEMARATLARARLAGLA